MVSKINKNTTDKEIEDIINKYAENDIGNIENLEEINYIFSDQGTIVDLMNRLKSSKTEFGKKTLIEMEKLSPLSLAVVFE